MTQSTTPPIRSLHETSLRDLVSGGQAQRATVLLPLEGAFPRSQKNTVMQRHAVEALAKRLENAGIEAEQREAWGERLAAVRVDARARARAARGLAILMDERATWVQPLVLDVELSVRVARDFRLREVLRSLRRERPYRVLALSTNRVALFVGSVAGLDRVEGDSLPDSLVDALGPQLEGGHLDVRGGSSVRADRATRQGTHAADHERDVDLERFHRAVAEALRGELSDDGSPLVLAADSTHQSDFRALAKLPALMDEGVEGSPDHWSDDELHARTWAVVERAIEDEERRAAEHWEAARRRGKGLQRLADVASAAVQGRVRRLWLDAEAREPGYVDPDRGDLVPGALDDDALDALAACVLRHGGEVVPVPAAALPEEHSALAELR